MSAMWIFVLSFALVGAVKPSARKIKQEEVIPSDATAKPASRRIVAQIDAQGQSEFVQGGNDNTQTQTVLARVDAQGAIDFNHGGQDVNDGVHASHADEEEEEEVEEEEEEKGQGENAVDDDPCLDAYYACTQFSTCCNARGYKKPGRSGPCKEVNGIVRQGGCQELAPPYDFTATWVIYPTSPDPVDCPAFPKTTEVPAKCCDGGPTATLLPLTFINPSLGNCNYMQGFVPSAIGVVYGACAADGTATYGEVCRPRDVALRYPVTEANQDFPSEAAELLAGAIPINITRTTVPPEGCGCAFTEGGQMDFTKTTCAGERGGVVDTRLSGNPIRFPTPIVSKNPKRPAWTGGCERVIEFSNNGSTRCFAVTDIQEYGVQFASSLPGNIYFKSQGCTRKRVPLAVPR